MGLNAGDLTRRIVLERDEVTQERGAEKRVPSSYSRPWSKPEPLSGRELARAQQLDSRVNWRFTLRYRTDAKPQDRVVFAGKRMEIRAVLNDEDRREWTILLCEAKG